MQQQRFAGPSRFARGLSIQKGLLEAEAAAQRSHSTPEDWADLEGQPPQTRTCDKWSVYFRVILR
eukprot:3605905-Heterocapsa_arctica.AAC.1